MTAAAMPPQREAAGAPAAAPAATDLAARAKAVDEALTAVRGMPIDQRTRALALKDAIEAFHKDALVTIVRALKADPAGKAVLLALVDDPGVYALFAMHGIVKADLRTRVAQVIEGVRPYTQSHGGDVELVDVTEDAVFVRLMGSCNGCSMSSVTLRQGVEAALKEQCPEITRIEVVPNEPAAAAEPLVTLTRAGRDAGWVDGPEASEVVEGTIHRMALADGKSLVLIRVGSELQAFRNECAHLGLPIDGGMLDVADRTITCPWHGFRFDCTTGECLSHPQAQLEQVPLRVQGTRIQVRPA
jgi:Fe-S cluster biogenesis protein NfuA/nitrite reductase/ring-hydroxylating ferredoxin subunit